MKVIIESAESKNVKKYISKINTPNGHDCWGKTEYDTSEVVRINGKNESIFSGCYIAHDEKDAICVGFINHLPTEISSYLSPKIKREEKTKRYKTYLKLQKEFSVDSEENISIKREFNINSII
jgi:hypothetical protein